MVVVIVTTTEKYVVNQSVLDINISSLGYCMMLKTTLRIKLILVTVLELYKKSSYSTSWFILYLEFGGSILGNYH